MRRKLVVLAVALGLVSSAVAGIFLVRASAQNLSGEQNELARSNGCSNRTLQGTYGFSSTGTAEGFGSIVDVGQVTFDGHGNLRIADTISIEGTIYERTLGGTYRVGANCRGSATLLITVPVKFEAHIRFVIVDNGEGFRFMQSDPGSLLAGSGEHQ